MADQLGNSVSQSELDNFFTPKQILFLGADLVGSTALKQKKRRKSSAKGVYVPDTKDWAEAIQIFYSVLTTKFKYFWEERSSDVHTSAREMMFGAAPILWKTIGDELIFRKLISHKDQLARTMHCFVEAVKETTKVLRAQAENDHLELKCVAWLAECPIQNKVLIGGQFSDIESFDPSKKGTFLRNLLGYERNPVSSGLEVDFVGPAIDIGFRLAKQASSRRFVLSIDTAYLYLRYSALATAPLALRYPVRFSQTQKLDGVMGGVPYPIFWIDLGEANSTDFHEDELRNPSAERNLNASKAIQYCEAFYREQRNYVDPPFIYGDNDSYEPGDSLQVAPPWHEEVINSLKAGYDVAG